MDLGTVGKFIMAVSLCFFAFTLVEDQPTIAAFNKQLNSVLTSCDCIPVEVAALMQEYLRFVVVGLLGCSVFMVFVRSSFVKFLVLLGIVILVYIKHHPIRKIPDIYDTQFWESIAIIGGLIFLMGADKPY